MDIAERIDAAIDAALVNRIVGCVVLVRRDGKEVYARAAGFADREGQRPMARNAIFRLASVTKPIVATAVLRMADLGLLRLDDPVTNVLPWFTPPSPRRNGLAHPHPPPAEPFLRHQLQRTCHDLAGHVGTGD